MNHAGEIRIFGDQVPHGIDEGFAFQEYIGSFGIDDQHHRRWLYCANNKKLILGWGAVMAVSMDNHTGL